MCFYGKCPFKELSREDARAYAIYRWVFDSGSLRRQDDKKKLFPDDPHSTAVEHVTKYYFNLKMHRHALRIHMLPKKLWLDVMYWVSIISHEVNREVGEDEAFEAIRQRQALRGW